MKLHILACAFLLCLAPGSARSAPPGTADIAREAEALLARNYRADGPGAAVLVARGDTILFRAARGEADLDRHVKLQPDSVFRIGSVTKQLAAAGLLKLVEAGKVKLEDPLSKYLPDYPGGQDITLLQLLNHTAGIRNYTALDGYMDGPVRSDLDTARMIATFSREKPDFEPGTGWAYSNSGYVLVGAVIEVASRLPWHVWLDRKLFRPLGMTHTGYGHDPRFAAMQVRGYSYEGNKIVPMRILSMTQPHAAGALVSNVDDLLKWNRALHEGRVLKSASYARMITPVGKAAGPGYGLGLFRGKVRDREMLMHGGGIFGFASSLAYLPGPDISVVILENDDSSNAPDSADRLSRKLAALALGDPYPELRLVPVDAAALQAAEGAYRFDGDVVRVLRLVDGKLTSQRGKLARQWLMPIGRDDFLYEDGFSRMKLERGADGAIAAMRFFPGGDGPGEVGIRATERLEPPASAVQLPRAALERLVGTYAKNEFVLKVYLDGEALKAQLAGQPPVGLSAMSPLRFEVEETGATLEFSGGEGAPAEVVMRQNRREMALPRVK